MACRPMKARPRESAERCSTSTPFGRPVEPEVNITYIRSAPEPAQGGKSGRHGLYHPSGSARRPPLRI